MAEPIDQLNEVRALASDRERAELADAMAECCGNIARMAQRLNLSRYQVYRRLEKHGLKARGGVQ